MRVSSIAGITLLIASSCLSTWCVRPSRNSALKNNEAEAPILRHGMLQAKDGKIIDRHGQVVQLKGMGLYGDSSGDRFWNAAVVKALASDWKVSVVRASVPRKSFADKPELEIARVRTLVDAAQAAGVYVVINWYDQNADQHADEAVKFFGEMASIYGQNEGIIFEIFHQPMHTIKWPAIKSYAETVIAAIRATQSSNLVIVGTPIWSQRVDEAASDPLIDPNIAYALHFHAAYLPHQQQLRDTAQKALDRGLTLFVSEFGSADFEGKGPANLKETDRWLEFLDRNHISWINWSIRRGNADASALLAHARAGGFWPDNELTPLGLYLKAKFIEAGGSAANKNASPAPKPHTPPANRGNTEAESGIGSKRLSAGQVQLELMEISSSPNSYCLKLQISNSGTNPISGWRAVLNGNEASLRSWNLIVERRGQDVELRPMADWASHLSGGQTLDNTGFCVDNVTTQKPRLQLKSFEAL